MFLYIMFHPNVHIRKHSKLELDTKGLGKTIQA